MPLNDADETVTRRYFVVDARCREALHIRHPIRTAARDAAAPGAFLHAHSISDSAVSLRVCCVPVYLRWKSSVRGSCATTSPTTSMRIP
jgi:hypothetical protein